MNFSSMDANLQKQIMEFDTPFFVYDLDRIMQNYKSIVDILNPDRIYFAVKSNSQNQVLKVLKELGSGFEVNTTMEMQKTISAGATISDLINSAPIKIPRELKEMYKCGIRDYAFDSKDELDKLMELAPGSRVYLRIYSQNEGSNWHLNKKFGADIRQAVILMKYAAENNLVPYGLTFHVGSQCVNTDNWEQGIRECANIFKEFGGLKMLNIGGGFPASYKSNSVQPINLLKSIKNSIDTHFKERPILYVEPGRFITADAAITVTSVIGVKEGDYLSWAYTDMSVFSGFIELIEDAEKTFGYYIETLKKGPEKLYNIAGASCAGSDVIGWEVILSKLERDDKLIVLNTGAYTWEYGSKFNGLEIPNVYYIKDGRIVENEKKSEN